MPMRIPWDKYEAAVLIDACVRYNDGKIAKSDAVSEVSEKLRNRAMSNGVKIDEFFRNENGIAMQFALMNELLTNQKSGLRGASKLFIEMANIYKNNKVAYQEILNESVSVEANQTILRDISTEKFTECELKKNKKGERTIDDEANLAGVDIDTSVNIENSEKKKEAGNAHEVSLQDNNRFGSVLLHCFENGFRVSSSIDKARFRMYYAEQFGESLNLSDLELVEELLKIGNVQDGKIYVNRGGEYTKIIGEIYDVIIRIFENGASCIYEEAVYKKYNIALAEKAQLYDAEELGNMLLQASNGKLRKNHSCLCLENRQWNLEQDVLKILKHSPVPMTYDDIQEVMWYVPIDRIKSVMINIKSVVYMEAETYFYAPNLPVSSEELVNIKLIIQRFLQIRSYITDTELRAKIYEQYPNIEINTVAYTTYGLRNCLAYIFRDEFSFHGPIISERGKAIGTAEVFADYCKDREQVTSDELKELAAAVSNNAVYWDAVRSVTIRISDDIFIRDDLVVFDVDAVDRVLDEYTKMEYTPLKNIGLFTHFPSLSIPWNGYVLESYLYRYSMKFHLLHASFSASGYFGVMIRAESMLTDYKSLIIDALAHSDVWHDKRSALDFLVENGYQKRRRYEDIEFVVKEAALLREKIKEAEK